MPIRRCWTSALLLLLFTLATTIALAINSTGVVAATRLASTVKSEVTVVHDIVRALVERAAKSWITGDAQAFAALFTPDGEFVVPGQRWVGREAIEKVALEFAKDHCHINISIQRIITDHQQAVVEWRWEEIETSTGKQSYADDAVVIDFADGYIKRWREYIDSETPKVK